MMTFLSQFHFLRPLWLLAIVPALLLVVALWRQARKNSQWYRVIPAPLLQHLLEDSPGGTSRWRLTGLTAAWVACCLALAGPAWEKLPQPVQQSAAAVAVILDLSPSMYAEDVRPSRLVRARYKLTDYLTQREEGLTALVAYAGEAHIISPFTDDNQTLINLLPILAPDVMPLAGSNTEMAMDVALQLFADAGINRGDLLLATDGITPEALPTLHKQLADSGFRLSILGVGSTEGAPIPTGDGGFTKDSRGNIAIARLNETELQNLARDTGGRYTLISADNRDIRALMAQTEQHGGLNDSTRETNREFDNWRDRGQLLALLLLPAAALAFRRGWLLSLCAVGLLLPEPAQAFEWQDLWLNDNQQAQRHLEQGEAGQAAQQFTDPQWRASARYRSQDYQAAAEDFATGQSADAHYNRGNALARAGKLEDALSAYDEALTLAPDDKDTLFNKKLVEDLLEQQQQSQEQQSDSDNDNQQQSGEQQSADNQNSQQQNGSNNTSNNETEDQQNADSNSNNNDQNPSQQSGQPGEQPEDQEQQAGQPPRDPQRESEREEENRQAAEQMLADMENRTDEEKQQALEQWLRQVPDDPAGLLRNKLEYEHNQLRRQYRRGQWQPPSNAAYERL